MTILVTGGTGTVGTYLLRTLSDQGASVYALTRDPGKAKFPEGVIPVKGDMLDVDSMRSALGKASTLFLLNAVTADEVTQALLTLNLAREAGLQRIVYFSVFRGKEFTSVPHFAGKFAVEQMIEQYDIPATILRPNCFMQNHSWFKDALLDAGVYPFSIGDKGVSMVDARDVADVAAVALLERERATEPLPHRIINVAGPEALTGAGIAAVWSELLGRTVRYGGDDTAAFEQKMRRFRPSWAAMDLRLMLDRFVQDGMQASAEDVEDITTLLGRRPRDYATFAAELLETWRA